MKKLFLSSGPYKKQDCVLAENSDYHHLSRVLRVKVGEEYIVGDVEGNEYFGKIISIDKAKIVVLLEDFFKRKKLALPNVTIFFAVLKGDKNNYLIKKCSEIGVSQFVPVITKNTIVRIEGEESNKIDRWKKIAKETAMQSCRKDIPKIRNYVNVKDIDTLAIDKEKYFGYVKEKKKKINDLMRRNLRMQSISFFIGPEGGFDEIEADILKQNGWQSLSISPNILKSDTAAIFISSALFSCY